MSAPSMKLTPVPGIPLIKPGDDLADQIYEATRDSDTPLQDGSILAIAQKIVSKSEGRIIDLDTVEPSEAAARLAEETGKDPRVVALILSEATRVVRSRPGLIIVEHLSGVILANAGIDHSNTLDSADAELVTLLPEDSNASARQLRDQITAISGKQIGVIITDSVGRPWRRGTVGIALGSSGVLPLRDLRGEKDLFGRMLEVSETADADSLAAAACLLMGEGDNASPVVVISGHELDFDAQDADQLLRPEEEDLFR